LLDEIVHFFISYNEMKDKIFKPLGRFGPQRARELVVEGEELFRRKNRTQKAGKRRTATRKKR
jgi:hypothetical protein